MASAKKNPPPLTERERLLRRIKIARRKLRELQERSGPTTPG